MKNKFIVILSLVFLLSFNVTSGTIIIPVNRIGNTMSGNHSPIRIIGNDQFTSENGVTRGSGTAEDPYVIEDWVIVSNGSASQGIFINDTNAYFVIRNCTIHGFHTPEEYRQGIQLSQVTHGTLETTVVSESEIGIYVRYSPDNKIVNCTCSDYPYENGYGISIFHSVNITIVSSRCYRMYVGIDIVESSGLILQKTECSNNSFWGLEADDLHQNVLHYLLEDCSFNDNGEDGVYLIGNSPQNTSYSILRNCSFQGNDHIGLFFERLSWNVIENSVFYHNYCGIYLDRSSDNIIRNCSFLSQISDGVNIAGAFFLLKFPRNNEISYCDFIDNCIGISLFGTRITRIHHCMIANNTYIGVVCPFSIAQVTSCNIVGNGRNYSEMIDPAGVYSWGSFFFDVRQNWWGSPQGPSVSIIYNTGDYVFKIIPLRTIDNSDLVMLRYGLARFRPWSSAPVSDAGRQMG